jgi:H+/Cl- antiporter ClcA
LKIDSDVNIKFANLTDIKDIDLKYIHSPIILGIIGGLLGALFINVNTRIGTLRKKYIKTKKQKLLEVIIFSCLTMTICFLFATFSGTC